MYLEQLTHQEKKIVFACLCAIAKGPFIHTGGLRYRASMERDMLYKLIEKWPEIDDSNPCVAGALNGVMAICHGSFLSSEDCAAWFSVDKDVIKKVYTKWLRLQGAAV
ncbi:MAG: hypothetical protein OXT69_11370 [Candidatus Poribacteria bacterium]|nr:hypothetical protein [Candidatus Poribacteria bacterium]